MLWEIQYLGLTTLLLMAWEIEYRIRRITLMLWEIKWGMMVTQSPRKANVEGKAVVTNDTVDTCEVSLTYDTIFSIIISVFVWGQVCCINLNLFVSAEIFLKL